MAKKKLFFQGREFIIEECENGDIIINNIRYRPEVKKGAKNIYKVKLNHKVYTIELVNDRIILDGTTVNFSVRPYFEIKDESKEKTDAGEFYVSAPIPGTISQIFVKKGEKIEKNQELMILEAMKMRNRILAPINGKVEDILVSPNENVQQDQKLVKIVRKS